MMIAAWLVLAQLSEPSLVGDWKDADLGVVSQFSRTEDGVWSAVVVGGARPADVGKKTFDQLTWNTERKAFTGKLIKPDDGQVVDVTLTVESSEKLRAEAGFFIFRKTLKLTRVRVDGGAP